MSFLFRALLCRKFYMFKASKITILDISCISKYCTILTLQVPWQPWIRPDTTLVRGALSSPMHLWPPLCAVRPAAAYWPVSTSTTTRSSPTSGNTAVPTSGGWGRSLRTLGRTCRQQITEQVSLYDYEGIIRGNNWGIHRGEATLFLRFAGCLQLNAWKVCVCIVWMFDYEFNDSKCDIAYTLQT